MNVWELKNEINELEAQQSDYMNLRKELNNIKGMLQKELLNMKLS